MQRFPNLYGTTIGKKVVTAFTGGILVLFVIAHMVGNLKMFAGPGAAGELAKIDAYGIFLRDFGHEVLGHGGVLWVVRVILLVAVGFHIVSAVQVWATSRAARPRGYKRQQPVSSTVASRSMLYTGIIIGVFVVYHILDLTVGSAHPGFARLPDGHPAIYVNVVTDFQRPIASAIYIGAMIALGFHLYHGVWSGTQQTLGINNPRHNVWQRGLAVIIAVVVAGGFITVPVAVMTGFLR